MIRTLVLLIAVLLSAVAGCAATNITVGPVAVTAAPQAATPPGTPVFSQTGTSLTINNCSSGQSVMYRTDGGPVTIASKLYSAPLTVTTGEVVTAICATIGAYQTNVQADVASATCHTIGSVGTGNGTPCDNSGSGYGTLAFASVAWNVASSATITATTQATAASSTQGLFIHFFSGSHDPSPGRCDACTTQVQDFVLTASAGSVRL